MNHVKKTISLLLTLCMLLSLLPAVSIPAAAADDEDEENVLSALGFDTGAEPDGYDSGEDASTPYGVPVTTVAPVKELYTIGSDESDGALLYGNNLDIAASTNDLVDSGTYVGFHLAATAYQAVAGNFDGGGLEGQVALLTAVRSGSDGDYTYDLDLTFIDPTELTAGADYQQSTRHLMEGADKFANSSVFIDDFEEFPVMYQGYLQITAGDFDGNGIDEIAVYIPHDTNPSVKVFQLQAEGTQWQTPEAWVLIKEYALSYDTYAPNQVGLTACDMTGDGIDDLGITWGGHYSSTSYTAGKAVVFQGSRDGDPLQTELPVPISNYEGYGLLGVSMAFGDVDGDGKDNDLVICGQSIYDLYKAGEGNINPWTRYLAAYAYDSDDESFIPEVETNVDMDSGSYVGHLTMSGLRTALAVVQKDGIGTQDYVYVDGILLLMDSFGFSADQVLYAATDMTSCVVYSAMAADFNGDGKETVAIMLYNAHPYPANGETTYSMIHCETDYTDLGYFDTYTALANYPCAIAAPDTDQDTIKLSYTGEHYLIYSDPEILAVVAAPPYFGDLEHLDGGDSHVGNSETAYASSSGSSAGGSASATFTSGGYISFEQELAFLGVKGAKIEAEGEFLQHMTAEIEKSWERSQTVEYGTTGGQDAVVLYSVPIAVYIYDAYVPTEQSDGSIVWEDQTMTINVPYDAAVRTLTVEDYDAIAEYYDNLLTVRGNILDSTPGYPASYPTSTAGYSNTTVYGGSYAGASYGSAGYIKQTLSMSEATSVSASYSAEISLKFGVGALGFTVGMIAGAEAGAGVVFCDMTGSDFSGTVFGMPEEAEEYGYGYNWKIFEAIYSDGEHTFPVVTYIVNSVIAPPDLPSDFCADVEKITSDGITLTWKNSDPSAVGFQLYRHYEFPDGEGDYPVGDVVSADDYVSYDEATGEYSYSYTEEGLEPYTEYEYSIQSIGGTSPYYSVLSDMVSAYTAPLDGQPEITLSDKTLLLYPDEAVDLSVTVTNDAEDAKPPLYQWQKLVDGAWTNLRDEDGSAFTFTGAKPSDAGTYRCRVNQVVGNYYISAYSDRAEVSFSKRTPHIEVTVAKDSDTDMAPEITATLTSAGSGDSVPSGSVTFEIVGNESAQTVTAELGSDGTATVPGWTAPKAGVYGIIASYGGSRVFKSASARTNVLIGTSSGFWMEDPRNLVYGESVTTEISKYVLADGSVTKTPLSELTGYTVSYQMYRQDYVDFTVGYVWTLLDEGDDYTLSGNTITPTELVRYKIEATITEDGSGDTVATLAQDFTVTQRLLTLTAPTFTAPQDEAVQPTADDLTITGGALAFSDTLSSLGLDVECLNSAGTAVTISSATSPGVYTTRVAADPNCSTAQANYDFTFVDGTYTVTGLTYPVTVSANTLMGETVGSIGVLSPKNYTNGAEYQYGTQILFAASPDSGYEVDRWTVTVGNDTQEIDPGTLENPNLLTNTMRDEAVDVLVAFKVQQAALTFGGTNGSVVCSDSAMLQSGDNVIAGASYTFKAVPDEGYHFKEWRLYTGGLSYPADAEDEDGFHTCTITMGTVSADLVAVFERDGYVLSLGDHLMASYSWDDDGDDQTDDVLEIVSSGALITGDTEVTVEPAAGHRIADDGKWYVDGLAVTTVEDDPGTDEDETVYYSGQDYVFEITADTEISADTEILYYDVTVTTQWLGSEDEPDGNAVAVSVDGTPADPDALTDLAGGTAVTFTAAPAYGAIFDHWSVNGATIDPDTLTDPQVYTCGALGEDLEVMAVFTENEAYTVTVSKEAHGVLSYGINGGEAVILEEGTGPFSIPVYKGDTLVFTAQPDAEFMVGGWTVDDVWYQTTSTTCTLSDISDDHSLELNFTAKLYYTVNFSAGENGDISAVMDGSYTLASGDRPGGGTEITFTAIPDDGYMVDTWTVNGELLETELGTAFVAPEYIVDALSGDCTVNVTFRAEETWTVTLQQPENAEVTAVFIPDDYGFTGTSGTVRDGASAIFTVVPSEGYIIDSADIAGDTVSAFDDITVQDNGTWVCTLDTVTEDLAVSAVAEAGYTVTVATVTGGTATADPTFCPAGTQVDLTASPLNKYTFSGWTAQGPDGGAVVIDDPDAEESYLIMPSGNVTVTPAFRRTGGGSSDSGGSSGGSSGGGGGTSGGTAPKENTTLSDTNGNTIGGMRTDTENGAKIVIPRSNFDELAGKNGGDVTIDLGIVKMVFDSGAIAGIGASSGSGDISLMVEQVNPAALSAGVRAQIGDRPVFDFTLMAGDTPISGLEGTATVTVPYELKAGEAPDAVVVYYVDDSGELQTVTGAYDPATGTVRFIATHFSVYAVGYHLVTFDDVSDEAWYFEAVTFCAARGITQGVGENMFGPANTLRRGQFIVLLMRAYGIAPDEDSAGNFSDAGDTYYTGYLSAAKRLGISNGVGNNLFAPETEITRQDMFTLLFRALGVLNELPGPGGVSQLGDFDDVDMISDYAKAAMTAFVEAGVVSGSGGKLDPMGNSSRAQMVQVLYNLLSK